VKVAVLSDVAQAYDDFCSELVHLPAPEGLTAEELAEYKKGLNEMLGLFREKGKAIHSQVLELAAEFPVAPAEVAGLPASAKVALPLTPIDLTVIAGSVGAPDNDLYRQWEDAVKSGAWARAGFFFGQIKEKRNLPEGTLSLMRAVTLALSQARPEAIDELVSALPSLNGRGQALVRHVLYSQYSNSSAVKKAEKYADKPTGEVKL
jgi:hypothetical protein